MTFKSLRIGISCWPTYGGSGIVATELGLYLAERGHRVHFISYDVPSRLDRFVDNVFFHEVEVRDYPLFEHGLFPLALASKMVEVARWEQLDVLHAHYAVPHAAAAYLARQILRQRGETAPRIVTTLHGTDITLVGSDPSFAPVVRFSIGESDAVTVPSEFLRQETYRALEVPRARAIEVIPNFVDTDRFRPAAERSWSALRHLLPQAFAGAASGGQPRVLVHNSNFRALKRVDLVVRVFAEVQRRRGDVVLLLVGDGPERSRVEALLRELHLVPSVCLLGKQRRVEEVLGHADLFLLPSETESFGLAALEAQSCGVPVLASRVGGLPEVIADGETGVLTEPGDVAAMAEAACALLADEERRRAMGQAARTRALLRFRRLPLAAEYEALYLRLLGLRGGG